MNKFFLVLIVALGISAQSKAQFFSIPKWDYHWDQKAHEKGQVHFSYGYGQPRLDQNLFNIYDFPAEIRGTLSLF